MPYVSTIHSALSLKPVEMYVYRRQDYQQHKEMLGCVDTILIDEVSMIDCSLMDWLLSLAEESEMHGHSIRIILFGDVLQLPPVVKKSPKITQIWEKAYGTSTFFFNARRYNRENVQIYMLTKVYRQKDKDLSDALTSPQNAPCSNREPPIPEQQSLYTGGVQKPCRRKLSYCSIYKQGKKRYERKSIIHSECQRAKRLYL